MKKPRNTAVVDGKTVAALLMPKAAENKNIPPINPKAAYPASGKMEKLPFDRLAMPYLPAAVPVSVREICHKADQSRGDLGALEELKEALENHPNQRTYTKMVLRFVVRLIEDIQNEDGETSEHQ